MPQRQHFALSGFLIALMYDLPGVGGGVRYGEVSFLNERGLSGGLQVLVGIARLV